MEVSVRSTGAGRARSVRRVLAVEAVANLAAGAAKLAVGTATGSAALLGDAVHSLTDLTNNGVALFAARMAEAPPDREHHYGHAKIESMAVFALAIALVLLAVQWSYAPGSSPRPSSRVAGGS